MNEKIPNNIIIAVAKVLKGDISEVCTGKSEYPPPTQMSDFDFESKWVAKNL